MYKRKQIPFYKQDKIIKQTFEACLEAEKPKPCNIDDDKISNVVKFIHNNIFERYISAREIRYKFDIGARDMASFRKIEKAGIFKYVQKLKMEAAKKSLQNKRLNIYMISFNLFYNHEQSFSRAFKNYFDISPSEYRESL